MRVANAFHSLEQKPGGGSSSGSVLQTWALLPALASPVHLPVWLPIFPRLSPASGNTSNFALASPSPNPFSDPLALSGDTSVLSLCGRPMCCVFV